MCACAPAAHQSSDRRVTASVIVVQPGNFHEAGRKRAIGSRVRQEGRAGKNPTERGSDLHALGQTNLHSRCSQISLQEWELKIGPAVSEAWRVAGAKGGRGEPAQRGKDGAFRRSFWWPSGPHPHPNGEKTPPFSRRTRSPVFHRHGQTARCASDIRPWNSDSSPRVAHRHKHRQRNVQKQSASSRRAASEASDPLFQGDQWGNTNALATAT